ncbi:MAG: hypothetical protein AAF491_00835 [Verrucomicrobiota bacterium]
MKTSRDKTPQKGLLLDLPWWYRPSFFLLGATLPALLLFAYADPTLTLSRAQLFFSSRDLVVGLVAVFILVIGAVIGESGLLTRFWNRSASHSSRSIVEGTSFHNRLAEAFLSQRIDWILMGIFLVAHLIFFRNFFANPALIAGVLEGNLGLKQHFKTIPGVTTWTQVSLILATIRGLRWSGVLPGNVKLISWFHVLFFATLFVRAILWSERLALIEGVVPFFLCAAPKLIRMTGRKGKILLQLFPVIVPVLLLAVFIVFEFFRSWQSNSMQHGSILQFGWLRLFTYYFEAMNTGAATLGISGFYDGLTTPMSGGQFSTIYNGLYQGSLDKEFNNPSGIWYLATFTGNLLFAPVLLLLGAFNGIVWRAFREGRILGFFYPIVFLGMMELLRIHYWFGTTRVLPSTIFILFLIGWALLLPGRIRPRRHAAVASPREEGLMPKHSFSS